jgi:hypothetical protein
MEVALHELNRVIVLSGSDLDEDRLSSFLDAEGRGWMAYRLDNGWLFAVSVTDFDGEPGTFDELEATLSEWASAGQLLIEFHDGRRQWLRTGQMEVVALKLGQPSVAGGEARLSGSSRGRPSW